MVDLFMCCYKNRDIIQCIQLTVYSGLKNMPTGKPRCKLWLTGEIAHQFCPLASVGIGNRLLTALARCDHGVKGRRVLANTLIYKCTKNSAHLCVFGLISSLSIPQSVDSWKTEIGSGERCDTFFLRSTPPFLVCLVICVIQETQSVSLVRYICVS